jgi:hypothetical protein
MEQVWLVGKGGGQGTRKWVAVTEKEALRWWKWDKKRSLGRRNKCGY